MKSGIRVSLVLALVCAVALAEQSTPEAREVRHRQAMVATRAIGYLRSADAIEARLQTRGMTLRADVGALRQLLENALDEADVAIAKNDFAAAGRAVDRAQALLEKFVAKLGG